MMSLLSLSLFASVCLMVERNHVIFVRVHLVAGAEWQTRPLVSRAGS